MAESATSFKPAFALFNYIVHVAGPHAKTILGGSATPYLSLADLISLSTDPEKTRRIFTDDLLNQPLALSSDLGALALRENIASLYSTTSGITAANILVTNAATGANHIVERTLLAPGDHAIVQYPIYGSLIEEPLAIGCTLSYWRGDASDGWRLNPNDLKDLIKPGKTKMILLTNPGNPTGSFIDRETQRAIISIAREHDLIIHCDEIFRPLFHSPDTQDGQVPSFVEHTDLHYDKVIVTSSLSKTYGLSGVRIGWITTRNATLYDQFITYRNFCISVLPKLDETVAAEALSPRCRPGILKKHLSTAKQNLDLIDAFARDHKGLVEWTRPKAGSVAFVKFLDPKTGQGRDEVEFCDRLVKSKGVLLSPGTTCFEFPIQGQLRTNEFKGRVRFHFTLPTNVLKEGLQGLTEFLAEER